MLKKSRLILLFLFVCLRLQAAAPLSQNPDLVNILKLTDNGLKDRQLVKYILTFYRSKPLNSLASGKREMDVLLVQYKLNNRAALNRFIEYAYQQRLLHITAAEKELVKAIQLAAVNSNHHLLYSFYNELGFLQTYTGNTSEAIYSFSRSKKEAILLDNPSFEVIVDINISDIFYKNNFYKQSLSYLEDAQKLFATRALPEVRLKNIIYNNIAENYFRMGYIDSLRKYNALLNSLPNTAYKKYIFTKRTDYYVLLSQHQYKEAIQAMVALKKDSLYYYDQNDEQNLADGYYNAGMLDSARVIINRLLDHPAEKNHPEVKYHLYDLLGMIAQRKHDDKAAANNFKMALQQSKEQISRLTQVDNISSQIKLEEVHESYIQKEERYKRERLGLIYVLIIAMLTVGIIAMIFSATRQKRYYDKLFFDAKNKELSFINSHEVRRHLSNLLGLISLIKDSKDKHKQYLEVEEHMLSAVESLDGAIKTISEKLENVDDKISRH